MSSPEETGLPGQERMDAISGALARLLERQEAVEQRLLRIEGALGLLGAAPVPPPLPVREAAPPPLPVPSAPPPFAEVASAAAFESRFGLGWMNSVAVVTLIFGVGFLFKYAVDNQWIGPGMRVALGVAAAMLSLFVGEWISLRGQKVFARGLTGLGLALLYLSFYAGFGFYHLLPQGTAFLLMFLTTCAGAALALHYDAQAVAWLGLIGGYLTPVLLSTGENRMWVLAGYTLLLNLGALGIARVKRWPALEYLAWVGTGTLYLGWSDQWLSDETRIAAFEWLSMIFVVFFAASAAGSRLWLLAVNTGVYFAGSYGLLDRSYHGAMGSFALLLALLHGGLAAAMWGKRKELGQLSAAIGVVLLTLAIPIQFVGFRITMLWSLEAAVLAWIARRFQVGAWALFGLVFVRLLALDSRIYVTEALVNRRFLTFAVAAASLWIASRAARSAQAKAVSYGAGHFSMLWALALEVNGWVARNADVQDVSNEASTGISILMAVYGVALVVAGVALRSTVNRVLGLGLLGLVIAKLYLLDVWSLSRGFRITAFLALGGLLLLVSYLYSRCKPAIERLWKDRSV
ncbi:MAG TPA: DUF2339 domain-containing protein [Bryobacteraceae bacterium]|nr:DUF2339 domain-containing protein [Bryobacteraceae bacterium]